MTSCIELSSQRAAEYLARALRDGRSYHYVLAEQRRGRRKVNVIPFHYKAGISGRASYYWKDDLQEFVRRERARGVKPSTRGLASVATFMTL